MMRVQTMDLISRADLKPLMAAHEPPCVSLFMPAYRIGRETQQNRIILKNLVDRAEERLLEAGHRRPDVKEWFAPADDLLDDGLFWQRQAGGLAIFVSPGLFRRYRVPLDFEELVVVGPRFHLVPLFTMLGEGGHFYVLALSQNQVRLLEGSRFQVGEVDLEGAPGSMAEALRWDDPEKQLQLHTGAVSGTGGGPQSAIFHGHGTGTDDALHKTNLLRYFQQVDRGLQEVLAGERAPLVLAGVEYLLPIYHEANSYDHLLGEGVTGNPEDLNPKELHERAWRIVQPGLTREQQEAADLYRQMAGTGLASDDVQEIVAAAYYGRVERLFVAAGQECWGTLDPSTGQVHLHDAQTEENEDLLNLAALHAYQNDGEVHVVEPEALPGDGPAAAVFRYQA